MPRAPGRPRTFDPEQMLRTVSRTFHNGGYASTSLDDIARATGLQRPSLYAAFGDKRSMYLSALALLQQDIVTLCDRLEVANLDIGPKIAELFSVSINLYLSGDAGPRGCLAVCTAAAEAVSDEKIKSALNSVLTLVDERLERWFEQANAPDPETRAQLVASTIQAISVRARAGQPRDRLQQIANYVTHLVVADL